jgi:hypothetical protein
MKNILILTVVILCSCTGKLSIKQAIVPCKIPIYETRIDTTTHWSSGRWEKTLKGNYYHVYDNCDTVIREKKIVVDSVDGYIVGTIMNLGGENLNVYTKKVHPDSIYSEKCRQYDMAINIIRLKDKKDSTIKADEKIFKDIDCE